MASNIVQLRNSWDAVAGASDEIVDLVEDIPGWDYEYADETRRELESAAVLLRRVVPLLKRARDRECLRYRATAGKR
jgi:hypothetical protein